MKMNMKKMSREELEESMLKADVSLTELKNKIKELEDQAQVFQNKKDKLCPYLDLVGRLQKKYGKTPLKDYYYINSKCYVSVRGEEVIWRPDLPLTFDEQGHDIYLFVYFNHPTEGMLNVDASDIATNIFKEIIKERIGDKITCFDNEVSIEEELNQMSTILHFIEKGDETLSIKMNKLYEMLVKDGILDGKPASFNLREKYRKALGLKG